MSTAKSYESINMQLLLTIKESLKEDFCKSLVFYRITEKVGNLLLNSNYETLQKLASKRDLFQFRHASNSKFWRSVESAAKHRDESLISILQIQGTILRGN